MKNFIKISRRIKKILSGVKPQNFSENKSDWNKIIETERVYWDKVRSKTSGKKILIATSTGGHLAVTPVESLLAVALTLRGARVHFLLCDRVLPACLQAATVSFKDPREFVKYGPQKSLCDSCYQNGLDTYLPLVLPIHLYSDLITDKEYKAAYNHAYSITSLSQIKQYKYEGLALGEHALAGTLRYFAKASIEDEPDGEKVLRRYIHASFLTVFALRRLLLAEKFDCAVFHHGLYVPQGIIGEVLRDAGVRVVNWNPAYRKKCFVFSHGNTYHHALLSEKTTSWENISWTKKLDSKISNYLKSRWEGTQDWIWFHEKPTFAIEHIVKEYGIDMNKPIIGMLTNVMWDAQLHYPANAFPDMRHWIVKTIRYFIKKPQLQLVIRVHPAEIRGTLPSRQYVVDLIRKNFSKLPKNIITIPPESQISTYAVMGLSDTVLIYGTKTGVELTSQGTPVIVAGEAWIRNKGITMDAKTAADYFRLLDKLPLKQKMNREKIIRARKYAFHFFYRRMIPIRVIEPASGWPPYKLAVKNLEELMPCKDKGLDVICEGILNNKEFIYKAEEYE